jgi:hypothetical protein
LNQKNIKFEPESQTKTKLLDIADRHPDEKVRQESAKIRKNKMYLQRVLEAHDTPPKIKIPVIPVVDSKP